MMWYPRTFREAFREARARMAVAEQEKGDEGLGSYY